MSGKRVEDCLGNRRPNAGDGCDLIDGCCLEPLQRPELLENCLASDVPKPRDFIEQTLDHSLSTLLSLISNRETVCFIADPLQQIEALGRTWKDHGVSITGEPDFLEPLS